MRKFTIAHLEIRKLNFADISWLSVYAVLIFLIYYLNSNADLKQGNMLLMITPFLFGYILLTTQFGLRLRSVYFSTVWLILCVLLVHGKLSITFFPLLISVLYHILRIVFWKIYHREFIPFDVGRGKLYRQINNIEQMGGTAKDKDFMKIFLALGFIFLMICLFGMIGVKL